MSSAEPAYPFVRKERGRPLTEYSVSSEEFRGETYYLRADGDYFKPWTYRGRRRFAYYCKVPCACCRQLFMAERAKVRAGRRVFCSPPCLHRANTGARSPDGTKNKRGSKGGYLMQYAPDHPHARKGYVAQHRIVMETALSRILAPDEFVHHINGDVCDNRIENLVVANKWQHRFAHESFAQCAGVLLKMGVLGFDRDSFSYFVVGAEK